MKESQTELSEDMEVIGPGQMLAEAREALNLTQKDVAKRLNFTVSLVVNIENEHFDNKLPATFTRGYLKNYARLVNVSEEDILASYELLDVAAAQQAEMQSFSRITEKQAENNRLMWISYFIVALLIASTVVWWMQEHESDAPSAVNNAETSSKQTVTMVKPINKPDDKALPSKSRQSLDSTAANLAKNIAAVPVKTQEVAKTPLTSETESAAVTETAPVISTAVFKFSGDCWVNIYDATGERVAWGIKKADYVMKISGKAPFNVTLGKPELVSITFNGKPIDMSKFGAGNIAKFTLPLTP